MVLEAVGWLGIAELARVAEIVAAVGLVGIAVPIHAWRLAGIAGAAGMAAGAAAETGAGSWGPSGMGVDLADWRIPGAYVESTRDRCRFVMGPARQWIAIRGQLSVSHRWGRWDAIKLMQTGLTEFPTETLASVRVLDNHENSHSCSTHSQWLSKTLHCHSG